MAHFNNTNDADFYSTSSASEELDANQTPSQRSIGEWADDQVSNTSAYDWNMVERQGLTVRSPTSSRATTSHELVASASSHMTEVNSCGQTYPGYYRPTVGYQAQPYNPGSSSQGSSFASTIAKEASAVVPALSSGPLNYWGEAQSGLFTSSFYANVRPYQPSTGPTRTGSIPTGRLQPYGTSRARTNEYGNTEPSRWIFKMTADAEKQHTDAEEDKAPTTKRTRRPYGQGLPRQYRTQMQEDAGKLRSWVQRQKGLAKVPSLNSALAVVAKIIPTIRSLESSEPHLLKGQGGRTAVSSKDADKEFERRNVERRLLQELSRYFPLEGCDVWTRSTLLSQVVKDLEDLSAISGPSSEPDPGVSTPTVAVSKDVEDTHHL